jgi:hypothetical protein
MIEFEFTEFQHNPLAPTIFVNKIGGLHRLSPSITKLSFALTNGHSSATELASLIWEAAELDEAHQMLSWAMSEIGRGGIDATSGLKSIRAN